MKNSLVSKYHSEGDSNDGFKGALCRIGAKTAMAINSKYCEVLLQNKRGKPQNQRHRQNLCAVN